MEKMIGFILLMLFCGAVNRFCGVKLVPFKPLLLGAPLVGVAASFWFPPTPLMDHTIMSYWVVAYLPAKLAHFYFVAAMYRLSIGIALAFLFWRLWEWGRWIDLGSLPNDHNREGVELTVLERLITSVSFGSDSVALIWRHMLLVPALWIFYQFGGSVELLILAPGFALAFASAYVVAKYINSTDYVWMAEIAVGFLWALLIDMASRAGGWL